MGAFPKISTVLSSQLIVGSSSVKGSIPMAVVITSPRGSVTPQFFSEEKSLVSEYGEADLAYGKSLLYADTLLRDATDNLTVVRAVSGDSKFSGVLLKAKRSTENLTDLSIPMVVDPAVSPIGGLTQAELDAYQFPLYPRTRTYAKVTDMMFGFYHDTATESIYVTNKAGYNVGDSFGIGTDVADPGGGATLYTVKEVAVMPVTLTLDKVLITMTTNAAVVNSGMLYIKDDLNTKQRIGNVFTSEGLVANAATQELVIPVSDFLINGTTYQILDGADTLMATVVVNSKTSVTQTVYEITFETRPTGNFYSSVFYEVTAGDFEYHDSALIVSKGTGVDTKNISIGTFEDTSTENSFGVRVYYKGIEKESHVVSMNPELDGNNIQLEIENIINKRSRYVKCIKNTNMIGVDGKIVKPLLSEKARWQRIPEIYYVDSTGTTVEDFVPGDMYLKVSNYNLFSIDDRIQLSIAGIGTSKEYKVVNINSVTNMLTLDRPSEETITFTSGAKINMYDATVNIPLSNVYNGYIKFPVLEQDTVYPVSKDSYVEVGGYTGLVLDGGANKLGGGNDGSPVTTTDLINALDKISDVDQYPHFFVADAGFTDASYIRALINHAQSRETTHAFTSCTLSSEFSTDPVSDIIADRNAVLYSSSYFSFTADWFYMSNPYTGQENIPMPPSLSDLLAEAGAITTDGIWTAAAGWRKGKYFSAGLVRIKNESERQRLYKAGINTSKFKLNKGISKWSELTGLNSERPLQYRSAAKLAIYIIYNLNLYMEDKHFEDYDENQISTIEEDISAFMAGVFNAGGIYDFQVVIGDLVTDYTVSLRKLPIYVAATGKQFIQGIDFALDLQAGTKTSVNLATARKLTA